MQEYESLTEHKNVGLFPQLLIAFFVNGENFRSLLSKSARFG